MTKGSQIGDLFVWHAFDNSYLRKSLFINNIQ